MRLNLTLILSIVIAVGLVAFGFTYFNISSEREKLYGELESRAIQIANEVIENKTFAYDKINQGNIDQFEETLINKYNLIGVAIYYSNDSIIGTYASRSLVNQSLDYIAQSFAADTAIGNFIESQGKSIYQYIRPIQTEDIAHNAIVFYTDAEYIENIINSIWLRNFARWFMQALFVSLITLVIIRWGIFSPIDKIAQWIRAARLGNLEQLQEPPARFLEPLHKEIISIARAMNEAKASAEEEARLRTSAESVWTPERLKVEMENLLQGKKMVVVSNREPYMHLHEGKVIKCIVPASGMITAMEPVLKACGGLWIASGTGDADRETVDKNDKIKVPPENPSYTLRRLWLTKEEEDHYYYGFANEGLWPLCHIAHTRPVFRKDDWLQYQKVNQDFANAVIEETADEEQPFILIQDYHFALLPALIKKQKPLAKVAIFWHIPWPNPESFGICPWQKEILMGMLGADLIGFHTQYHCNHFLETVNSSIESRVLWENFSVKIGEHITFVKPFPISIAFTLKDFTNHREIRTSQSLLSEYGINATYMGIGVDRIDYTKGIIEKFLAVERFLEKYPAYQGKFTFVELAAPSRTLIKSYADLVSSVEKEAERINWRFKSKSWKPILLLKKHHSHEEIKPFYAAAHLCMVTSLHDGMNLVAKEYVAERNADNGVLILSRFAGASQQMSGPLIINPYDIERSADAIKNALEMTAGEQERRMKLMRQEIVSNNVYSWAANLLKSMSTVSA